jgi:intein/homing endonuclease
MPNKRKELKIAGANLWYLVGLITSDGCLSKDGRHIDITSKDYGFLRELNNSLGLTNKIGFKNKSKINEARYLQFSNRNLYEFLLSVGLTPRKSLTQNKIDVPDEFFCDFLRGLIDGDGSIKNWIHPSNKREQWSLRVYSPSVSFMEWLQKRIEQIFRVRGRIHRDKRKKPRVDLFVLKYGKVAAKVILNRCYYKSALSLDRKAKLAQARCLSSIGWKQSKTVLN